MSRRIVPAAALLLLLILAAPAVAGAQSLVAVVATPSGDGNLHLRVGEDIAFGVAVVNYAGPRVLATFDMYWDGDQATPFTATVCPTDPATGACGEWSLLSTLYQPGVVKTFSVFVHAIAPLRGASIINNRLILRWTAIGLPQSTPGLSHYTETSVGVIVEP